MLPNCPQFLITFYGALKAGAVVTAVNPLYTPRELEYQLNDADAETLVTLSKFYPKINPTLEAAIHKCMEADPEKRFASISQFLKAISRLKHEDA